MSESHRLEVENGQRFEFGKNWQRFIENLDEEKIREAELSLKTMLRVDTLKGKTFLDIGSGSGLFSLAARRLGAEVTSFDYDPYSVNCTNTLRKTYYDRDAGWKVLQGSVLDSEFVAGLGQFDVVYSWGVLHHTGNMALAIDNAARCVKSNGLFFIALYNDQGWISKYWAFIKRLYNKNSLGRLLATVIPLPYFLLRRLVKIMIGSDIPRGMSFWRDIIDWVGGYPFEVASPEAVVDVFFQKGFSLNKIKTVGNKLGCNEFVFKREGS